MCGSRSTHLRKGLAEVSSPKAIHPLDNNPDRGRIRSFCGDLSMASLVPAHENKTKFTMLKKIAKGIGIFIGSLVAIILAVLLFSYLHVRYRINKEYAVVAEDIEIKYDSATILTGGRLAGTRACKECHGQDLGGSELVDDPLIGRFVTRNLTKGKGGLPSDFGVKDWVLAMKHGLNRKGKPLLLMPSHELSHLSEEDMAAIIAYCTQVPPVDREPRSFRIGPLGYALSEFDLIPLLPAENTDH